MNFRQCDGTVYIIRKGDTLYSISRRYNIPLESLFRANPYVDMYNLIEGDELCLPIRLPNQDVPATPGEGPLPLPMPSVPSSGPLPLPVPMFPAATVISYIIKDTDTIEDVLLRFGIDLNDFFYYNTPNSVVLKPGMVIHIPR